MCGGHTPTPKTRKDVTFFSQQSLPHLFQSSSLLFIPIPFLQIFILHLSRLIFKKWNSIWGFTVWEATIYTLSLCAWLGRIDDLWSYLLWGIIKINEPYGTWWMPPEIYYSGCSFFLLCWCCQESYNKCKHRRVLIANVEQGYCDVAKYLQLCCLYSLFAGCKISYLPGFWQTFSFGI